MSKKMEKNLRNFAKAVNSNYFFYLVTAAVILQALWFIFSFQPWIFDEPKHLGRIYFYLEHILPFVSAQDAQWDKFGDITRNGSYMFYYIMSWPLRLFGIFTADSTILTILLRLVSLSFVVGGLMFYRRALLEIKQIPKYTVNLTFLILACIPSFVLLAGAVNYDNLVFLLFEIALYSTVLVVKEKEINTKLLMTILAIGLTMSVIKWTAIALFLPLLAFVTYDQYKKHGTKFTKRFVKSYKKLSIVKSASLAVAVMIAASLFIERPVMNTLKYGKPQPQCVSTTTTERCNKFGDHVAYSKIDAKKTDNFQPLDPISYIVKYWGPMMLKSITNVLELGKQTDIPIAKYLFAGASLAATALIILYLRTIKRDRIKLGMLLVAIAYTLLLLAEEYRAYVLHGAPSAIRFRYLIPVIPIFIYFAIASLSCYSRRHKLTLVAGFVCFMILATQGGGIITGIMTTPQDYYWKNDNVQELNSDIKHTLSRMIVD